MFETHSQVKWQVLERLVWTLEHMTVHKVDMVRYQEELASSVDATFVQLLHNIL